jgi:MFS family permease
MPWLAEPRRALRAVFANPALRRLQLAEAAAQTGSWAYAVALSVYAYREGGAAAVGVLGVVTMVPAAILAPFVAALADRHPRGRVMTAAMLARSVLIATLAAVAAAGGPIAVVFALAAVGSLAARAYEPARAAALPSLVSGPDELTAANAAFSTTLAVAALVGPALAGLGLAVASLEVVLSVVAALALLAALALAGLGGGRAPAAEEEDAEPLGLLAGFRAVGGDSRLRVVVGVYATQTLIAGALSVLVVVVALELVGLGEGGVGLLNAALGVGGIAGAIASLGLVGRRRLSAPFIAGLVAWGAAIAAIGAWPEAAVAVAALTVVGIADSVLDVVIFTLLQRIAADELLGRVFGVLEALAVAATGVGALLAPALVDALGIEVALMAAGGLGVLVAAASWPSVAGADAEAPAPQRELELLRAIPLFAPLSPVTLEGLAEALRRGEAQPGEVVVAQDDRGRRFYVIASGKADVTVDGRHAAVLGPGDHFGEIALLRDVARTATVRAIVPTELYTLDRDEFLAAVTGHGASAAAAETVVAARLARARPALLRA